MYNLLITEAAEMDLDSIVDYIAVTLANPAAATTFLDQVEEGYQILRTTPLAYAACSDDVLRAKQYRKAVINNYLLIYRVDQQTVYVLRFFFGRQDYARQL